VITISLSWSGLIERASAGDEDSEEIKSMDLLMPNVQPQTDDTYLCFETELSDMLYIIGFKPKAKMSVAHHMLIYGCAEPIGNNNAWDCGEMKSTSNQFEHGPVCKTPGNVIYAWGMDAPDLKLPDNVGFKVGKGTGIKSLVIQVHYKDASSFVPPKNGKDHSGVILTTTTTPQAKTAGVFLLAASGKILPHSTTYMETACPFEESLTLHPFAFRVHAHEHGQVVSGYRVRDGQWTELGRESPQMPQMFYPVTTPDLTIKSGDILAARCTMKNYDKETVYVGSTSKDEMCNFYIMYYINGDKVVQEPTCFSPGPPSWNWGNVDGIHPENAPFSASMIPDTDSILKETQEHFKEVEDGLKHQEKQLSANLKNMWKNFYLHRGGFKPAWEEPMESVESSNQNGFDTDFSQDRDLWSNEFPKYNHFKHLNKPSVYNYYKPMSSMDDMRSMRMPVAPVKPVAPVMPVARVMPVAPVMSVVSEMPRQPIVEPIPDIDESAKPSQSETMTIFHDKNGGKGYEKVKNVYKQLNVPNGKGFYQSSHKVSSYSYNSESPTP
jgi:peptidylglycine monooxygenase